MLTAVTGIYRNSSIELLEKPANVEGGAEVVVTSLPPNGAANFRTPVSLRGIWAGKIPEDTDIDAIVTEVRSEWEQEWEDREAA